LPSRDGRGVGGSVAGAFVLLLLLFLSIPLQYATGAGSAATSIIPVASPNPVNLPAANPGSTVSAPVTIYFSNASKPISLVLIRPTMLQTKNGNEISNFSIMVSPNAPVTISGTTTFEVTVRIPSEAKPGNYSGQLILVGANGGVATVSVNVGITYNLSQYLGAYWGDLAWILVGILVSFAYSPLRDAKPKTKAAPDAQAKSFTALVTRHRSLGILTTPAHFAVLLSSIAIGVAAFAYFLTVSPGFGVNPFHDAAVSILDGFVVHRLMDGVAPGAKG
jgi:hypothetical protein